MKAFIYFGILVCTVFYFTEAAYSQRSGYHVDPTTVTEWGSLPKPPYPFGEIPIEHILLSEYPADTHASAVILFDFGSVYIDGEQNVVFERHRRIRILKPDGIIWGVHEIPYYTSPVSQTVREIEGHTYNLPETGSARMYMLESEMIVDERIAPDMNRIRFTLPALQAGSVIEYRYKIVSENPSHLRYVDYRRSDELKTGSPVEYRYDLIADEKGLIPDWEFQTTEPVLWSELNLRIPEFLEYSYLVNDNRRFDIYEEKEYTDGATRFNRGTTFRWVRKNMPALREEPFITTIKDYVSKISFRLAAWYHPQGIRIDVLGTWEEFVDRMSRSRDFGRQADPPRTVRRLTSSLVGDISDPVRKLEKLYDYVRTTVNWNGTYSINMTDRPDRIHENQSGNSADIAIFLTAMLRAADIDAHPVLLSTRDNGKIRDNYPVAAQFNHVITYTEIDGIIYLLDATNPMYPAGVLPYNTLNDRGLLIKRGEVTWIQLEPSVKYSSNISGWITLDGESTLSATMHVTHDGYGALSVRRILEKEGEIELLKSFLGSKEVAITVDSLRITGKNDIYEPVDVYIEFLSDDHIITDDEFLHLNPTILGGIDENPFELPDRTLPIDFAFLRESSIHINIRIPDGYQVSKKPESVSLSLPDDSALYTRHVAVDNGIISYMRTFDIKKTVFSPREYRRLRGFFNHVISMESQPIVLERIEGMTLR